MNSKKKPNFLIQQTSPYLLQHAYNPVEWHAWGKFAFEKAIAVDKPILVSIGYSACHWCHVMEHESFEDEVTAAFMNQFFINIKVDREERPDVDIIYMNACQILTGAGGWPLNMFLTPQLKAFTGGTYYPPKPNYGKPSWMELLVFVKQNFDNQREKVEQQANLLAQHTLTFSNALIHHISELEIGSIFSETAFAECSKMLSQNFDTIDGGFGGAPKFPGSMTLRYLMHHHFYKPDSALQAQIQLSLQKMMYGGIYDQICGGFSRYTVDKKWLVPHFEKMLYDNALLLTAYAEALLIQPNSEYQRIIEQTFLFIEQEMMSKEGGFYSAFDADSEGEEGKYYTWTKQEIEAILQHDAAFACKVYDISQQGNWEHVSILHRNHNDAFQQQVNNDPKLAEQLQAINLKLLQHRTHRVKPSLDDKIILSWNALMVSAYVQTYKAVGANHYKEMAHTTIHFLLDKLRQDKSHLGYFHTYKDGIAKYPAFLEDYATLIAALIDFFEISSDYQLLEHAIELNHYVIQQFFDDVDGFFYFTSSNQTDIPLRNKEFYDLATPSGNSVMANNLIRLALITGNEKWRTMAEHMIASLNKSITKHPSSFSNWLLSANTFLYPFAQVSVIGENAANLIEEINKIYYPNRIVMAQNQSDSKYAMLAFKQIQNNTLIYLCKNATCLLPVTTVSEYKALLQEF